MNRYQALIVSFCLCVACFGFDLSYMFSSISEITQQLQLKTSSQWLVNLYMLLFTSLIIPFSAICAKMEKKGLYLIALAAFCVSIIIAFFGKDLRLFLLARAISGISFAMLLPVSFAFVEKRLSSPYGVWVLALGIGLAIGPLMSAYMAKMRYPLTGGFFLSLPFALMAGFLILTKAKPTTNSRLDFDPLSPLLLILSTLCFVWGLIELPTKGLLAPTTANFIISGMIGFGLFCTWEKKAPKPILHTKSFFTREFFLIALSSFISSFALFLTYFIVPLFAKHILKMMKMEIGLLFILLALPLGVLGYILIQKPRISFKSAILLCIALIFFGCYLQTFFSLRQTIFLVSAIFVIGAAGGLLFAAISETMKHVVVKNNQTKSFGQFLYFFAIGLSFATALGSAFYRFEELLLYAKKLSSRPGSWINQILSNIFEQSSKHKDYIGETINRFLVPLINKNFLEAVDHMMLFIMGFCLIVLIVALFLLKNYSWKAGKLKK